MSRKRRRKMRRKKMKTKKWGKFMFYAQVESFDSPRNYVET